METKGSDPAFERMLERYSQGDASALGELVARESQRLSQWLDQRMPARLQRRVGVSDIIQLTAVELVSLRPRFQNRGAAAFRKLLRTIAGRILANAVAHGSAQKRDSQRSRRRAAGGAPRAREAAAGDTPSQQLLRGERIAAVQRCVARLPAADQEIIRFVDYEGLGYAEISLRLAISEAVARKRHSRAVARLQRRMDAEGMTAE